MPGPEKTENKEKDGPSGDSSKDEVSSSIMGAFNLGVSMNQQARGAKSMAQVVAELGEHIFSNLSKAHGDRINQEQVIANTEYLIQVALLGYIVPSVCDYEEDFKNRLLRLIESRARKQKTEAEGKTAGKGIIINS